VGVVRGGEAVNVVPDRALCRFNVRVQSASDQGLFQRHLDQAVARVRRLDGISAELHGGFSRPPRPLDGKALRLLEFVQACGADLGLDLAWRDTGGVSDANLLAASGLAAADGLGPRGGGIHTSEEFLVLDSLPERARLVARCLMGLGAGESPWKEGKDERAGG
jgi:glutamate carboxypeptidase